MATDDDGIKRPKRKKTPGRATQPARSRYTPPIPISVRSSPKWVPICTLTFFGLGVVIIILNYLPGAPILPGDTNNWYLLVGLGLISLGFLFSTRWR